jgi:hypothetical protein
MIVLYDNRPRSSEMTPDSNLFTIREAQPADDAALRRLAAAEASPLQAGQVMVAEVDGEIVAAAPLAGGPTIADSSRPTPSPANLIELRAAAAALRHHRSTRARLRGPACRRRSGGRRRRAFVPKPAI